MSKRTVAFQSWEKGDYGRAAPSPNVEGGFRGKNVIVYPNGAIGPRPPFFPVTVTGLPSKQIKFMIYNGAQSQMVVIFSNREVWKFSPTTGGAATSIGTLATTVDNVVSSGNEIFGVRLAATGSGGVRINVSANTITEIAAMPNSQFIVVYGAQYVVGNGGTSTANRLQYSALGDPTTWPGNFVDVGDAAGIAGMFVQRNALAIPKTGGDWWVVTGVLGSEVIRRVEQGLDYIAPAVLTNSQNIWWINERDMGAFSGAQMKTELRPDVPGAEGAPTYELGAEDLAPLSANDDLVVVGTAYSSAGTAIDTYAHIRTSGTWTRHTLPLGSLPNASGSNLYVEPIGSGDVIVAVRGRTGGAGDLAPTFYRFQSRNEYPNISGRNDGTTAVPTVGSFDTPEFWPEDGAECTIKQVIVDLSLDWEQASPNTGAVSFTVGAEALNRTGRDAGNASTTIVWSPSIETRTASAAGFKFVRQRWVGTFGDQGSGGGGVLHFTSMKGVIIHRVVMVVDIEGSDKLP